ncbi:uncharacterized protein BDV14DRAFT_146362 [Aspergillus stella-maris]|uniref:uncharacterized protein n=1 Tax=Aspergillus stella-maris TaxID=1810926 RepID=UPI003CCDFB9C
MHFVSKDAINSRSGGPNDMFRELQETDIPIMPGCLNEHRRRELKQQLQRGHINKDTHDELWLESYNQLDKKRKGTNEAKRAPDILHMVVQHGAEIQKYYEHSVHMTKNSKLRSALTSRYIKSDQVDPLEVSKGDFVLTDDQVYDGK